MRQITSGGAPMRTALAAVVVLFAAQTAGAQTQTPTFAKDVAPIMQRACQNCHRPEAVAPMSLLTYDEVRPWARSIKARVAAREMPPWHIDRNVGITKFKDDPSLTDAEISAIVRWVDGGAPMGNPADLPPPRKFSDVSQWFIGKPDVIVSMEKPYILPPSGPDNIIDVLVDPGFT